MYSRKIKQMKKKLLNSSSTSKSSGFDAGGSSGGGGLNSNWGPRVALYEKEQQEQLLLQQQQQRRRASQEQDELYNLHQAQSQEIYKMKSSRGYQQQPQQGAPRSSSGSSSSCLPPVPTTGFKNPYATSGIGIHTSNGFICKTNKKLLLGNLDDDANNGINDGRNAKSHNNNNSMTPLRLGIPLPGPGPMIKGRRVVVSPPLTHATNTNNSLASTKTYHSSGGSSISSSSRSSLSSRNSSLGRNSLIVGSDHQDVDDDDESNENNNITSSGNYNINNDDDEGEDEDGDGSRNFGGQRKHGIRRSDNKNSSLLVPSSLSSSTNNIKLITINHIYDENELRRTKDDIKMNKDSIGLRNGNVNGGYYSKNLIRSSSNENAKYLPNSSTNNNSKGNNAQGLKTSEAKNSSRLMQGFNMVYVPMESTKSKNQNLEFDDSIEERHARRQLKAPNTSSDNYSYGTGFQLPEEEIHEVVIPTKQPTSSNNNKSANAGNGHCQLNDEVNKKDDGKSNSSGGGGGDVDSLLESLDSVLFKPKFKSYSPMSMSSSNNNNPSKGSCPTQSSKTDYGGAKGENHFVARKKTPPPLPPKNKSKLSSTNNCNNGGSPTMDLLSASTKNPQIPPSASAASKSNKNLRFSEHLDVKSPSPYTTISYDTMNNLPSTPPPEIPPKPKHLAPGYIDEDGGASMTTINTGPASRGSMYSACTTTTTLLSCGHLRDSYSTLSSINSRESFNTNDNEDDYVDEGIDAGSRKNSCNNDNNNHANSGEHSSQIEQQHNSSINVGKAEGIEEDELNNPDDVFSNKSALQQLRDLSILIGGSFHTSPIISPQDHNNNSKTKASKGGEIIKNAALSNNKIIPNTNGNSNKQALRKCSTETSNDSGKGSATGSGRSRSEVGDGVGGSGSGSIIQLLQHLPPPPPAVTSATSSSASTNHVTTAATGLKNDNDYNKRVSSAGNNKINPLISNNPLYHQHHQLSNNNNGHTNNSTGSCSCDSSLSSCLFSPDCEECQQVFRNPFEILPELHYIESIKQPQPTSSSQNHHHKQKKPKKELVRKSSYKIKGHNSKISFNPKSKYNNAKKDDKNKFSSNDLSISSPILNYNGGGLKSKGCADCPCNQNKDSHNCCNNNNYLQQSCSSSQLKLSSLNETHLTKTELLMNKSASAKQRSTAKNNHNNNNNNISSRLNHNGCLGCYHEQLLLASNGHNISHSNLMMINPNLFTIDEAIEEAADGGTLQQQQQQQQQLTSSSSKIGHHHNNGSKTKRSHHKSIYGGGRSKKKSSASKKHHHHGSKEDKLLSHSHNRHHHHHRHDHPKCWLATDGSMGWSDLESIYSQNMKKLEEQVLQQQQQSNDKSLESNNELEHLRGECLTCWRELSQYKYNSVLNGIDTAQANDNDNYTVERTKRMFIWLNRRPKEFNAPWWEAKKQASIKWLITKAYSHLPKGSVQHPFKESKKDKTKLALKEQVMAGLATGKLYCMALENLFQNCSLEEQQSIFGSTLSSMSSTPSSSSSSSSSSNSKDKKSSKDHNNNNSSKNANNHESASATTPDPTTSNNPNCNNKKRNLNLSHWEIIKILSRKGIYVAQPSDMKLTEGTLRQKKPFRITAHIALIEAVMGLYAKVLLTRERIEPIVTNLGYDLAPDVQTSEEFILAWVNAVIDTLKVYILSSTRNLVAPSPNTSSSSIYHRWLNLHPITDIRDLFDGIGICSLLVLYFSTQLSLEQVHLNEPDEPLSIYDSTINHDIILNLTHVLFPQIIHHLRLSDLLYVHGYMKQNILQLLLDIFYYTEIDPIDSVCRLTSVPLRILL